MAKTSTKKLHSKRLLITACSIGAIAALTGLIALQYHLRTVGAVAVADQLQPDSSWNIESDNIVSAAPICAKACPEVIRTWTRQGIVTNEVLSALLPQKWRTTSQSTCDDKWYCNVRLQDNSTHVSIYISPSEDLDRSTLLLIVRGG